MDESERTFRDRLEELEAEQQRTFDKMVVTLSGGALGLSFAFIKDFVPLATASPTWLLICAWASWALSITATLTSHLFSAHALRLKVKEVDGDLQKGASDRWDRLTGGLNITGGVCFVVGVVLLVAFVALNLGNNHEQAASTSGTIDQGNSRPLHSAPSEPGRESRATSADPAPDPAVPGERQEVSPEGPSK